MQTLKIFSRSHLPLLVVIPWLFGGVVGDVFATGLDESIEMRRYRCGYNSVYVLLKMSGVPRDYHSLSISRNSGKDGLSVQDLVDELSRCGLPSHAMKCAHPSDIRKLSPPFIVHTNPDRSGRTIGHFYVVTKINPETLDLIDGTTGEQTQFAISRLGNVWDGVAIMPERSAFTKWKWSLVALLASVGFILVTKPVTRMLVARKIK